MKNIYFLLTASLLILITSCGPTTVVVQSDSYQPPPVQDVSYQSFYDELSPYGNWINYPGYGYVWMPNAGPDFRPYASNGNWIYTDAGWTWASNYSWGWAPFHYGRWFYENGYGWMWLPGNEWAPAWVSWRGSGDYYGWAPLGPRVSIDVALNSYNPPANYWNFVPRQYIANPGWHNYYVNENRNMTIINNTTVINNYSGTNRNQYAYAPGPDPNEVRRVSGNNFTPVQLRQANTPGERFSGSQYTIYHPRVNATASPRGDAAGRPATPAPARYESFNNVRPSNQRPAYNQENNVPAPANNQPVNNPRPANQNPNMNQPANNPQPPVNNPRPAMQNPAFNQPNNNPQPGSNNPRPANQNPNMNQPAVQPNQPVKTNLNDTRVNRFNQTRANAKPAQTTTMPTPSPVNHVQTTVRPVTNHNPNNGHPVQTTTAPQTKPDQKPTEKPKTREANND
jgi:hypothetical protein